MGNKKLVLIGGGGHCKSVLDAALRSGVYEKIVITDPEIKKGSKILGCEVVGDDEVLQDLKSHGFDYAFITVGNIENATLRKKLVEKAKKIGFQFPVIIDPSATVSEFSQIGEGSFIGKNVVVNSDAVIGNHCIINTGAIIEHECKIGDFTHVAVGGILCGNVTVGKESFIGAGSTVVQGRDIGNQVIVGASSLVLTDVEENMKVFGSVKPVRGGYNLTSIRQPSLDCILSEVA